MLKFITPLLFSLTSLIASSWTTPMAISTATDAQVFGNTVYGTYDVSTNQMFAGWTGTFNTAPSPYYSTYTSAGGWTTSSPINTTSEPLGDVVLGYIGAGTVCAAFSDESIIMPNSNFYTSGWGPQNPISSTISSGFTSVYLSFSAGNQTLYASWVDYPTGNPNLAFFDNITDLWVGVPTLVSPSSSDVTLTCDNSSNVYVAWASNLGIPTYAIYNGTWSTPLPISPGYSAGVQNKVYLTYDALTNEIFAAWADGSRLFNYSIYSNGAWSSPQTVSGTDVDEDVYLAYDSTTEQVFASWADKPSGGNPYYAVFKQGTWTVAPISTSVHADPIVTLAFASGTNTMFAFWTDFSSQAPFWSSLFTAPPQPVTNLTGKRLVNDFGTESEMFALLRWLSSPTPDILGYHVYQNGVLIATLSPSTLTYEAHNLTQFSVVYSVTAFNSNGDSSPVSVTIN